MIVLIRRSGAFLILNLAGLSEPERNQLHTILSAALPKK